MDLSTITSALYLGVLFVCFISVAWKAAFPFLSNDATHSPFIIKSAFSFTSGLSLIVFFLIWAEFGDWLPNIRPVAWQVSINALLVLLIIILPLLLCWIYFSEGKLGFSRSALLFTVLSFAIHLFGFYRLGDYIPRPSAAGLTAACLSRIGFLGISLIAGLSGFGAVSAIWSVFAKKREVTETELIRLRDSINLLTEQSEAKKCQISKVVTRETESEDHTFISRLCHKSSSELRQLKTELADLSDLHASLTAESTTSQIIYNCSTSPKSFVGWLTKIFDFLFSLYCLYRIVGTTWNLTPWRSPRSDPISQLIALAATNNYEIDQEMWARQISFLLSGVVILGSIRAVLLVLAKASRNLPRLINQNSMALAFAIFLGCYNVSVALLLCRNLPTRYSKVIASGLGASIDIGYFDLWFDAVFLGGVTVTTIILWMQKKAVMERDLESGINEKRLR